MRKESLVSITDYSKEEILDLLEQARKFEENPNRKVLEGKVIATLFFEPSTRTRLSFETAVNRLGGRIIGFSDASTTSSTKGETLKDTIMMVSNYVDLIIMRHYLDGAARYASEVSSIPIINAGDGANQHPSQTMLDLYSIYKTQGTLENLNITMVGDLKYGRTVHIFTADNPRLFNIPPRDSKAWKKEYDGSTSVERSNKREKEDYKLEDGRHRSTRMWYCRLYGIMILQHLDAWEMPSIEAFQESLLGLTA